MEKAMEYNISLHSNNGNISFSGDTVTLVAEKHSSDTRFSLSVDFPEWEEDAYVFLPACAYNGNKMKRRKTTYPPEYTPEECGANPEPIITDVPALNPDGSGKIEVTSGDLSVSCFGVFFRQKQIAFFLFTEQACRGKNIGFSVESGKITVQFPVIRTKCYRICRTDEPSNDSGFSAAAGESVTAKVLIKEFSCSDLPGFFELFFQNRRCLLSDAPAEIPYTQKLWDTMEEHMNRDNFSGEYYAEMSKIWQCGWVGGGMSSLPLLMHGSAISKERAIQTLDYMTSKVSPQGFFYSTIINGEIRGDGCGSPHMRNSTLTRKNGDALYFLFKHFAVIPPKDVWVAAARGCADAFVKLYEQYQDFGQFVNVETGEMIFGGTTSGASAIGALVMARRFFKEEKYLLVAKRAGEKYYRDFVFQGLTYGGPGEALCAPDSESSYAMVESMVLLYEETGEEKWLTYAKDSLHLLSSWVMPYAYQFPVDCEFARLKINTVGSVFANVQNKHSAPGLCTASGDAIYKLYQYTGNKDYLNLLRDIVSFIPQCVSTEERPIFSWDEPPHKLLPGYICERVNTSDWEGPEYVGGVFDVSCWCETSVLLTFMELIWNEKFHEML